MRSGLLSLLLSVVLFIGRKTQAIDSPTWHPEPLPAHISPGCGIVRRRAKELGLAGFEAEFKGKMPVILEGHKNVRRARKHFTPEALLEIAGDAMVQVGDSAEIVRAHGQGPHTETLREFIHLMREPRPLESPSHYLFDRGSFFAQQHAAGLVPRLPFPPGLIHQRTRDEEPPSLMGYILDGNDEHGEPVPSWDNYLLLGGNASSVAFHSHADSVVALLFGTKRWFIFPPDTTPRPRWRDPRGMWTWADQRSRGQGEPAAVGIESGSELIECIQKPGDILYVPEGWHHATLNYGETLAVAQQARVGLSEWYRLRLLGTQLANTKAFAEASEVMEETLARYPERAEAHAALATLLLDMLEPAPDSGVSPFAGNSEVEEALWQRTEQLLVGAVQRDRTDDGSHVNLCKILTRRARAANKPEHQQHRAQVLQAARVHCDQAVALSPNDFHTRFYAGGERSVSGDLTSATEHYAAAVVLDTQSAEAHYQLARVLLRRAFGDGALETSLAPGAVAELSQAAELLCERCVAQQKHGSAPEQCECIQSSPRGRAMSLLVTADEGDGLLDRVDVIKAIEAQLLVVDQNRASATLQTERDL